MLDPSVVAGAEDVAPIKPPSSLEFRQCTELQNCQPTYHHGMDQMQSHLRISQHGELYLISPRRSWGAVLRKKGCGRFSPGKPRRVAFAAIAVYNRFKKHQRLDKYESSSVSLIRLCSRPCMRAHAQGGNTESGLWTHLWILHSVCRSSSWICLLRKVSMLGLVSLHSYHQWGAVRPSRLLPLHSLLFFGVLEYRCCFLPMPLSIYS